MHHEWHLIGADHIEGTFGDRGCDMREIRRGNAIQLLHDTVSTHVSGGAAGDEQQRR